MSPPSASSYAHKARPRQQGQRVFVVSNRDEPLINNRQAGRRRGRNNNPRQQGGGNNRGNGDSGNRIDNRARGNAAQLLEKYRNMARDAQMSGDRVNAEYYLQFADHYFRVLADNRTRQEEQQQRFQRNDEPVGEHYDSSGSDDGFESMDDSDESDSLGASNGRDRDYQNRGNDSRGNDSRNDDGNRNQQPREQQPRRDGNRSEGRNEPRNNEPRNDEGREQPVRRDGNRDEGRDQQPRREGNRADEGRDRNRAAQPRDRDSRGNRDDRGGERRPRVANDVSANDDRDDEVTIPLAALPPAIGRIDIGSDEGEAFPEAAEAEAPKPRRGRRPRPAEAAE